MNDTPTYSIVVPVYESSASVTALTHRLHAVFASDGLSHEIILVDDGSRNPDTATALTQLEATIDGVRVVHLTRNFGKAGAVLCGFALARGEWIVTIDDDLQQRPEDLPRLLELRHHDVVVATFGRKRHSLIPRMGSHLKSWFDRQILGLPIAMSPLKLIKSSVVREALNIRTPRPFIPALLAYVTDDFVAVPLEHQGSSHGASRYNLSRRLSQAANLILGNSSILLRMAGIFGATASLVSLLYASSIVVRKLLGDPIQAGWASLVVVNLSLGGLILVVLSIIGEYLIRILDGASARPPFIVRTPPSTPATRTSSSSASPR